MGGGEMTITCPCCRDELTTGDFPMPDKYRTASALIGKYGSMVCHGCADAHVLCDTCGKPFEKDAGMVGNYPLEDYDFCSEDCHLVAQTEAEAEEPEYTWP